MLKQAVVRECVNAAAFLMAACLFSVPTSCFVLQAQVLVHPECKQEVTALADYVGSTSGIIKYATASSAGEFIIVTEMGVLHELKKRNPDKTFYFASNMICPNMKKISLEKVLDVLEREQPEVRMDPERMLELAAG